MNALKLVKYCSIVSIFMITGLHCLYCQELTDTTILKALFSPKNIHEDNSKFFKNSESEMKLFLSISFLFYKDFISSQDVDACVFYPSCSVYAVEAIENKGIFIGLLAGFDRLLRCHPYLTDKEYPIHPITQKYYDPF